MTTGMRSAAWLLIVVVLSGGVLAVLDRWEDKREAQEQDAIRGSATVYLIAYDGQEPEEIGDTAEFARIGCEDILIPYEIPVVSKRLQSILHALSQYQTPLGLHNPMQEKGVGLSSVEKRGHAAAIIDLAGEPMLGGICDTPRLKGQIEAVVSLYEDEFELRLNGSAEAYKCIGDERGDCM